MRTNSWFLVLAVGLWIASGVIAAVAADSGPVTLTGLLLCGKCKLHVTADCVNVLQVDKAGQSVDYFLTKNKVSTDFHPKICTTDGMKVSVTGKVKETNGVEFLTPSKIEPLN